MSDEKGNKCLYLLCKDREDVFISGGKEMEDEVGFLYKKGIISFGQKIVIPARVFCNSHDRHRK